MHPHVEFLDRLAMAMETRDPKLSGLLRGIRDQVDAAAKATMIHGVRQTGHRVVSSVRRSLRTLKAQCEETHPELHKLISKFADKVEKEGSVL